MHLKPDPVAVEFLKQFALMFIFVIYGAIHLVGYASLWPRLKQKHSYKHERDEKRKDSA